LIYHSIINQ